MVLPVLSDQGSGRPNQAQEQLLLFHHDSQRANSNQLLQGVLQSIVQEVLQGCVTGFVIQFELGWDYSAVGKFRLGRRRGVRENESGSMQDGFVGV